MTDLIAVIPDFFIVAGAAIFALRSFMFSRSATGYIARNFTIVGVASVLFALAEIGHMVSDSGLYPMGELFHDIVEALFVVLLAIGISRFYPSWMPKAK